MAATAILLPTHEPAHASAHRADPDSALSRDVPGVRDMDPVVLPCPPWCEEDHGPHPWKDDLEARYRERWHSACLGRGDDVCVELSRTDDLTTGESSGERVNVGADCELGQADALIVARLLVASVHILSGRMTVAEWRSTSGVDFHRIKRTP